MRGFALRSSILLLGGLSAAGCVREAHIAMPSELAAAERIELTGMNGASRGRLELAGAQGEFTRSAERLSIADSLLVRRRGGGTFRISGPGIEGELSGSCGYRESEIDAGPVHVTTARFAYACDFRRDGRPIAAELVIEDPAGAAGTLHGRTERVGTLFFEGLEIELGSIHRDSGGGLPVPHALGYSFEAQGRPLGAVDLNGSNKTLYLPRDARRREAVIAGSLALAVLWDPAVVGD